MILIYTLGLLALGLATLITQRRARGLERKYIVAAERADQLAKELGFKSGNSNRIDLFTNARRQYELGHLVQIRDRLEGKFDSWTVFTDHLRRWRFRLLNWKGRLVPYSLGALDLTTVIAIVWIAGAISPNQLRESLDTVRALVRK